MGPPVDEIDSLCRRLRQCYTCAKLDHPSCEATVSYETTRNRQQKSVSCDEYNSSCSGRVCECDSRFATELSEIMDEYNENFHKMADKANRCVPKESSEKSLQSIGDLRCCGTEGLQFTYRDQNGAKSCCGSRTYQVAVLDCCEGDVLRPIGTCEFRSLNEETSTQSYETSTQSYFTETSMFYDSEEHSQLEFDFDESYEGDSSFDEYKPEIDDPETPVPVIEEEILCERNLDFCLGKENGLYAVPGSCSEYYNCWYNTTHCGACEYDGYPIFVEEFGWCDVPGSNPTCEHAQEHHAKVKTKVCHPNQNLCVGKPNDNKLYSVEGACGEYYACWNEVMYCDLCEDPGYPDFNEQEQWCDYPNTVPGCSDAETKKVEVNTVFLTTLSIDRQEDKKCDSRIDYCSSKSNGYYKVPGSCSEFYDCWRGVTYCSECKDANTPVFNQAFQWCDYKGSVQGC